MSRYIRRRLLICIPLLLGISLLNFIIVHLAPGDPADMLIRPGLAPEMIVLQKEAMGLGQPIWAQYGIWLKNILLGNWGYSYATHRPVIAMIGERVGPTFLLMGVSLLLSLLLAFPWGILSGLRQNSLGDRLSAGVCFTLFSTPGFFLGISLIYLFALKIPLFPPSGMYTLGGERGFLDVARHLALPAAALALPGAGVYTRYVRSCTLEVLSQDYPRGARAKGARTFRLLRVHMLRNMMITMVSVIGMEIPPLFCGAVVADRVFAWPGIGKLTMDAIAARDYPVLLGVNLIAAIIILLANLGTDLLYCWIDPRIRYSGKGEPPC
ncbi:MAG: ABC transporter permease [Peptococcaceae bacterium]|jgi:peptide/nickel transport system permease protein|nr:ABC transporter permease [Peptococcaceae bacterium]